VLKYQLSRRRNILKIRTDRQKDTTNNNKGRYKAREPITYELSEQRKPSNRWFLVHDKIMHKTCRSTEHS